MSIFLKENSDYTVFFVSSCANNGNIKTINKKNNNFKWQLYKKFEAKDLYWSS